MDIGEKARKLFRRAKETLYSPDNREGVRDYLMEKGLENYFNNTTEKQRERYSQLLDQNIDRAFQKYHDDLESLISRAGTVIGVATTLDNFLEAKLKMPASYITGSDLTTSIIKTIAEAPKVYHYLKNAMDINGLQGLTIYALKKVLGLRVMFIGPALEGNSLKYMLCKRIAYESKKGFLKDIGRYEPIHDLVKKRVEDVAGKIGKVKDSIMPVYEPAYQPA